MNKEMKEKRQTLLREEFKIICMDGPHSGRRSLVTFPCLPHSELGLETSFQ